ncbi:MAG: response regulator [Rhodocyclaceae bacterium]
MHQLAHILVVDDQLSLRTVLTLVLGALPGVSVHAESTGVGALAAIAAQPPDLLLLDAVMPGLDGPQTLAALRAQPATAELPVIFLTASADTLPPAVTGDPHLLGSHRQAF